MARDVLRFAYLRDTFGSLSGVIGVCFVLFGLFGPFSHPCLPAGVLRSDSGPRLAQAS